MDLFGQEGVYIMIHDGQLIAGEIAVERELTEVLRCILKIEEKRNELMKRMQDQDEAVAYRMKSIQQLLPSLYRDRCSN